MKQKILLTFIESGFGHISTMEGIYTSLYERYSDDFDIQKSYIMHDDNLPNLTWLENFFCNQVVHTHKSPFFGKFIFPFINFMGGGKFMRFFHSKLARKSFREGLIALEKRKPDVIVTNHYFTEILACEYRLRIDPHVRVVNYNPDSTCISLWDKRADAFIVNSDTSYKSAIRRGFEKDKIYRVAPCVRSGPVNNKLTREELRDKLGLPQDKFTVTVADGAYFSCKGPKYAREIIKSGLPMTLCVLAGRNDEAFKEFDDIANGVGKIKKSDDMTLKVFRFMPDAYELYGASDMFLTKAGSVAMLDSLFMHTPVMVNYCPNPVEKAAAKDYIRTRGLGEMAKSPRHAIKRFAELINDRSLLDVYGDRIEKIIEEGNGSDAVADIICEQAKLVDGAAAECSFAEGLKKIVGQGSDTDAVADIINEKGGLSDALAKAAAECTHVEVGHDSYGSPDTDMSYSGFAR